MVWFGVIDLPLCKITDTMVLESKTNSLVVCLAENFDFESPQS